MIILYPSFVNIKTLTCIILTQTLLMKLLMNLHFLSLSLHPQTFLTLLEKTSILITLIFQSISHIFTTFLNTLSEKNNLLPKHIFNPFSIQTLLQKESLFDLSNVEQYRTIEKNPHHWLTTDVLQIHHSQYQFFQDLTSYTSSKEQIQIYSIFVKKFFRHNYKLVWHSKFQSACVNCPSQFTQDELLPFLDKFNNHHPQFYNLLDYPSTHFSYLTYETHSIDNSLNLPPPFRPYAMSPPFFN